ncbi:MAG: hypothetical protein A3E84_04635 [Gammaproteobacteria bacterium RIFCSPHIGHO2_12_FULL_42_13]|nr:MAG: hypothetical protein A3E84_04635 [Gammaproteobacteria bacterium RIFCSPHIGHO2_12_FULL_42_13]
MALITGYMAVEVLCCIMAYLRNHMLPVRLGNAYSSSPVRGACCTFPYVGGDIASCADITQGTVLRSLADLLSYNASANDIHSREILKILQFACGAVTEIFLSSTNTTFTAPSRGICEAASRNGCNSASCADGNEGVLKAVLAYLTQYFSPNARMVLSCDNAPGYSAYLVFSVFLGFLLFFTVCVVGLIVLSPSDDSARRSFFSCFRRFWNPDPVRGNNSGSRDQPLIEVMAGGYGSSSATEGQRPEEALVGSNDHYGGTGEQGEGDREEENNTRRTGVAVAGGGVRPRMQTEPCVVQPPKPWSF